MQCSSGSTRCRGLAALLLVIFAMGCVRTAECDEHVGCDSDQVCFEHRCADRCQTSEDCSENFACTPCMDDATRASGGHCVGEEASACTAVASED
ncbi:MAG: hypothetical protein ACNA8W_17055 [Bradymonadaceae bacterium]